MFEELLKAEEGVEDTNHDLIYKAICRKDLSNEELDIIIAHLFNEISKGKPESIRYLLKQLVPTYTYKSKEIPEKTSGKEQQEIAK